MKFTMEDMKNLPKVADGMNYQIYNTLTKRGLEIFESADEAVECLQEDYECTLTHEERQWHGGPTYIIRETEEVR